MKIVIFYTFLITLTACVSKIDVSLNNSSGSDADKGGKDSTDGTPTAVIENNLIINIVSVADNLLVTRDRFGIESEVSLSSPFPFSFAYEEQTFSNKIFTFLETIDNARWELYLVDTNGTVTQLRVFDKALDYRPQFLQYSLTNGSVLFIASDDTYGCELWKTDGTIAGTQLVKDINPGPADGVDCTYTSLKFLNDKVYFSADQGDGEGLKLWRSDSTLSGTYLLYDFFPGAESLGHVSDTGLTNSIFFGYFRDSVNFNEKLFILGEDEILHLLPPIDLKTYNMGQAFVDGSKFHFTGEDSSNVKCAYILNIDLYTIEKNANICLSQPSLWNSSIDILGKFGSEVHYIVADENTNQVKILKSQGSAATTFENLTVTDVMPYTTGNSIIESHDSNFGVFFCLSGKCLIYDGAIVSDISSNIESQIISGSTMSDLYFAYVDGANNDFEYKDKTVMKMALLDNITAEIFLIQINPDFSVDFIEKLDSSAVAAAGGTSFAYMRYLYGPMYQYIYGNILFKGLGSSLLPLGSVPFSMNFVIF